MCFKKRKTYQDSSDWLDYALMADRYLEAAEIINKSSTIKNSSGLIMPLIYLLKHSIELSLKKSLKFDFLVQNKKLRIHDLKKLKKIFIKKTKEHYDKTIWDNTAKDRLSSNPMSFEDFIQNFDTNFGNFLSKSGFVSNDTLNQEQRYPSGTYSEPTPEVINIFFSHKDDLIELASKINIDIDIINDFILRVKNQIS